MVDPVFDVAPAAEEVNGPSSQIPTWSYPQVRDVLHRVEDSWLACDAAQSASEQLHAVDHEHLTLKAGYGAVEDSEQHMMSKTLLSFSVFSTTTGDDRSCDTQNPQNNPDPGRQATLALLHDGLAFNLCESTVPANRTLRKDLARPSTNKVEDTRRNQIRDHDGTDTKLSKNNSYSHKQWDPGGEEQLANMRPDEWGRLVGTIAIRSCVSSM